MEYGISTEFSYKEINLRIFLLNFFESKNYDSYLILKF